jgi:hypothetical protein
MNGLSLGTYRRKPLNDHHSRRRRCGSAHAGAASRCDSHYDEQVRTTIDLPDDLHGVLLSVARDEGRTLNQVVAILLRRALMPGGSSAISTDERTGLPVVRLGHTITSDDVRSLEDESP